MFSRVFGIVMVALAAFAMLPAATCAQRPARIQASAQVVRSVVPETQLASATQVERLTRAGATEEAVTWQSIITARGIAHVCLERPEPGQWLDSDQPRHAGQTVDRDLPGFSWSSVRLTIAFTAN